MGMEKWLNDNLCINSFNLETELKRTNYRIDGLGCFFIDELVKIELRVQNLEDDIKELKVITIINSFFVLALLANFIVTTYLG